MLYIPFGCASGNIDHKPGMSHYIPCLIAEIYATSEKPVNDKSYRVLDRHIGLTLDIEKDS
jgi:hypothetical protein